MNFAQSVTTQLIGDLGNRVYEEPQSLTRLQQKYETFTLRATLSLCELGLVAPLQIYGCLASEDGPGLF